MPLGCDGLESLGDDVARRHRQGEFGATNCQYDQEQSATRGIFQDRTKLEAYEMKYVLAVAAVVALATPAFADEVGVQVGPVGAGVTTGESHIDRDRDRDRTTVIKEREPADHTTVIKREHDEPREKTIIKERE
jgi:hypothetical protein